MPVAGPLAAVFRTLAKAIEDGHVKPPKPKAPQGRFVSIDALEQLARKWRAKAGEEDWGMGSAFDDCADDLEALAGPFEDGNDDGKDDEGAQP